MKSKVLTIDELSEKLKIAKKTIYKWTGERKIPCAKLGKHLRFIESDMLAPYWHREEKS